MHVLSRLFQRQCITDKGEIKSGNKAVLVDPGVHLNDLISITSLTVAGGALSEGQE